MSGLIPLALSSGYATSRSSLRLPDTGRDNNTNDDEDDDDDDACHYLLHSSKGDSRKSSAMQPLPATSTPVRPKPRSARPFLHKLSIVPVHRVPASPSEWKTALAEIKKTYLSDRYEQCSARCHDILDHGEHLGKIEPAYLVYLRFYAAMALEAQADPIHQSPHRRIALLQQAQAQYRAAADLAKLADEAMTASRDSSPMPSLRSSTGSDLSWSPVSTRVSSPTPSVCSVEDRPGTPEPVVVKPKKRVSFRDDPEFEPFIRPDSPTLGLDDWLNPSPSRPSSPEPILKRPRTLTIEMPPPPPPASQRGRRVGEADDAFVDIGPSHRCLAILGSLEHRLASRLAALEVDIAACQARVSTARPGPDSTARIERLRATGWRRPRFDARRYQAVRERALADLAE
ncbi:hypothetical protein CDD83_7187 [Cordyceps sp. RAO-2017]|nr:hypothetical protein CDD83_7187 [Cordyceps sp. RAO-2017]